MSLVSEIVSCRSMDFENQRRVVVRRDQGWKWHEIQNVVRTLQNEKPSETQCRDVYNGFNRRLGRKTYNYKKCGRKPWKVTPAVCSFLVKRLRALRTKCVCTATTLQRELKKDMDVTASSSAWPLGKRSTRKTRYQRGSPRIVSRSLPRLSSVAASAAFEWIMYRSKDLISVLILFVLDQWERKQVCVCVMYAGKIPLGEIWLRHV